MIWEKVRLGDVLDYEQPTNYIVTSDIYSDEFSLPVLTAGKSFILGYTNEDAGIYTNLPTIIFDDFTTESKYVDFPFKVKSSAMKILKAKEDIADIRFMYYLLQTLNVNSGQHKRYWISTFAPLEIPLPPLPIQKKIAEILDAADALKRKDEELLKKYDELAQAIFIDMFGDPVKNEKGWEVVEFGSCIEYIGDIGSNGSNDTISKNIEMLDKEDYAIMIRTTNLNANDFENNLKYVSEKTYNFFSKSKVFGGEIIMNKIGSAGDFWVMPFLNRPVSLGLNQLIIRLKNLNTKYLYYYLSTNYGKAIIKASINGAVTKSITKSAVKALPILYPSINLQNKFSEKISLIEKQRNQATKFYTDNLFNSLLQKAFNGELVYE